MTLTTTAAPARATALLRRLLAIGDLALDDVLAVAARAGIAQPDAVAALSALGVDVRPDAGGRVHMDPVEPEDVRAFQRRRQPILGSPYSAVFHYLKAVHDLKSDADGAAVVAKMKAMPTDDKLFGKGSIRADGRKIHPMYLFEVKSPAESKGPWDYYKVRATIPADEAFRPLADGGCPLVK